jgi:hypothetical protein
MDCERRKTEKSTFLGLSLLFAYAIGFCTNVFLDLYMLLLVDIMERIDYGIISLFKMKLIIISFNTFSLSLSLIIFGQLPVINFISYNHSVAYSSG